MLHRSANRPTPSIRNLRLIGVALILGLCVSAQAEDTSPPAFLQWFESSQETMIDRTADVFVAGFGAVWLPPPGRADISDFSVGYDVYDRFDLGSAGRKTLYGTETGIKTLANTLHRAAIDVHIDAIINHNGFSDLGTPGFVDAGGYPGMAITLPGDIDGDFNSAFDWGDIRGRLAGLIDIDHAKNHNFIRSPVTPGDPNNIPLAGTIPDGAGRLANVPTAANRRFYPDLDLPPIFVYDPMTGEGDIPIYPFNLADPMAGDATSENATGYLMRYLQWSVQTVGVDGFRIDAAKHIEGFTLDFFDRAVYRSNPRLNLDGSTKHVFSYQEVFDGDKNYLQTFIKKTIDPGQPGVVGANRDVLDFPLHFALRDNLSGNGFANDWHNIRNSSMDFHDDGLHNGSSGVMFVQSHDEHAPELGNVAHAYVLMHPGNAVVYFNGKEFGDNRDFPKDGRGDAIGGAWGDYAKRLVGVRNTHGRGDYIERWIEKEILAFERAGSAIVLLSNRTDSGYDSRTIQTTFAPGTPLIELTGAASDGTIDPHNDISELLVVNGDGSANVRFVRNSSNGFYHATGALIYGLSGPQAPAGIELSGVSSVLSGGSPDANGYSNGVTRLTDLHVVTGDTLGLSVQTVEVNLLGFHRDVWADGDNVLVKIDGGIDINGNGHVDFTTPGQVHYGFEEFTDKHEPLIGPGGLGDPSWSGDGEFIQSIDTTTLAEGVHFIEARAFRHRTDGGPAIYSSFKKVIYVDRLAPVSAVEGFQPFDSSPGVTENQDLIVRSTDMTADQVHVFLDEPASTSDADLIQRAGGGEGSSGRIDQDLFAYGFFGLTHGNHAATVVTFEPTGNVNVQRFGGLFTDTANGAGIGDMNFDGSLASDDLDGFGWGFEHVLYEQNDAFNPAGDVNGDGLIDNHDLYALGGVLQAAGVAAPVMATYAEVLDRRGNINQQFGSDQWDIDALYDNFGSMAWYHDLDSDAGPAGQGDVDQLVRIILDTDYGDANLDGLIDINDLQILGDNLHGAAGWAGGDFTGDGLVDLGDADLIELNWTSAQEFVAAWHEIFPGDSDGDGDVDDDDYHDLIAQFGGTPGEDNADFNNDGKVDLSDFVILREFFSQAAAAPGADLQATATPEPAAIALLGAAIPWVLRRKRKR
jgi:alpha-amylase